MNRKLNSALDLLWPNMDGKLGRKRDRMMIQKHNCQLQQFNLNNTVWVRNYNVSGKWVPGIVVSRTEPVSYVVQDSEGKVRRHVDQLCKCLDEFDAYTVMVPECEGSETSTEASSACHGPVI